MGYHRLASPGARGRRRCARTTASLHRTGWSTSRCLCWGCSLDFSSRFRGGQLRDCLGCSVLCDGGPRQRRANGFVGRALRFRRYRTRSGWCRVRCPFRSKSAFKRDGTRRRWCPGRRRRGTKTPGRPWRSRLPNHMLWDSRTWRLSNIWFGRRRGRGYRPGSLLC